MNGIRQDNEQRKARSIKDELEELISVKGRGAFVAAFENIYQTLKKRDSAKDIGLPNVLLVMLSPDLVQVLLLWVINAVSSQIVEEARSDAIRFVMIWKLCVTDESKASLHCFKRIREDDRAVPLRELYSSIVLQQGAALPIACPADVEAFFKLDEDLDWEQNAFRFDATKGGKEVSLCERWWKGGVPFLMWLQRDYLASRFGDFDPSSGRDDDTPYDVDHLIPRDDWGAHWTHGWGMMTDRTELEKNKKLDSNVRCGRFDIGDSTGNKWLTDLSFNRWAGAKTFGKKFKSEDQEGLAAVFDMETKSAWERASTDDVWSPERRKQFHGVVRRRAVLLYKRFFEELGLEPWRVAVAESERQR